MQLDTSFYDAAREILQALGAPQTPENVNLVASWSWCEKPHCAGCAWQWNNPLNTTWKMPGSAPVNTVGVQSYPDRATGIRATINTMLDGYYPTLVKALMQSSPQTFLSARGEISKWGTDPDCIAQAYGSLSPPPLPPSSEGSGSTLGYTPAYNPVNVWAVVGGTALVIGGIGGLVWTLHRYGLDRYWLSSRRG